MTFVNRVTWPVDPSRSALLVHDMQSHYLAELDGDVVRRLISNVRRIAEACQQASVPIFASAVPPASQPDERGLMLDMWGIGPSAGHHGLEPALGLDHGTYRVVLKRSYSAFYGNDFEVLLRRLGRTSVIITGVYTSIGCAATAMDAFMRDFKAFLVADATADFTPDDHDQGLRRAAQTCARVVETDEVLRAFSTP
jgi:isochorismate hydrolase